MYLIGRHAVSRLGRGTTRGYTILLHPDRNHNCLKNLKPSCDSGDRSFPIVKSVVPIGTVESRRVLTHELLAIVQAVKRIS